MHYKQNNKETKRYVQGLRPFVNTLPRGIKGILKKSGYSYSEIISKWNSLVGKEISKYSFPKSIKVTRGSSKKILVVMVKRGNELILEYSKEDIISKINSYFGYKLINEVRLQSSNNVKKKNYKTNILRGGRKNFESKINTIKNDKIRKSLSELLNIAKK